MKIKILAFTILAFGLSRCDCDPFGSVKNDVTKAVGLLEVAINRLDNNSADWQETLNKP